MRDGIVLQRPDQVFQAQCKSRADGGFAVTRHPLHVRGYARVLRSFYPVDYVGRQVPPHRRRA